MTAFAGFPPEMFAFFTDLTADNSKAFWQANKKRWERGVRAPMRDALAELAVDFGELRMFRPNRDVRFSADKSPYKLWTGATSAAHAVGGAGYYLEVSAKGIIAGYGAMLMESDQLRRFRSALDNESGGPEFEKITKTLASRGLPVTHGAEDPLKTAPRGYSTDHPRIEHLRWKGAVIIQEWAAAEWMHTPEAIDAIRDVWREAAPLKDWLTCNVLTHPHPAP